MSPAPVIRLRPESLDERIARRAEELTAYQTDAAGLQPLRAAGLPDEYEVARLHLRRPGLRVPASTCPRSILRANTPDFLSSTSPRPSWPVVLTRISGRIKKKADERPLDGTALRWLGQARRLLRHRPFDPFRLSPELQAPVGALSRLQHEADIGGPGCGLD